MKFSVHYRIVICILFFLIFGGKIDLAYANVSAQITIVENEISDLQSERAELQRVLEEVLTLDAVPKMHRWAQKNMNESQMQELKKLVERAQRERRDSSEVVKRFLVKNVENKISALSKQINEKEILLANTRQEKEVIDVPKTQVEETIETDENEKSEIQQNEDENNIENSTKNSSWVLGINIFDILKIVIPLLSILVGFLITRRKRGKFSKYLQQVDKVYTEYKMKGKRLEAELYRMRDIIHEDVNKGKINESAYVIIEKRIDTYLKEARQREMNDKFGGLPENLRENLEAMLEDGKISQQEYEKMKVLISSSTLSEDQKATMKDIIFHWKEKDL